MIILFKFHRFTFSSCDNIQPEERNVFLWSHFDMDFSLSQWIPTYHVHRILQGDKISSSRERLASYQYFCAHEHSERLVTWMWHRIWVCSFRMEWTRRKWSVTTLASKIYHRYLRFFFSQEQTELVIFFFAQCRTVRQGHTYEYMSSAEKPQLITTLFSERFLVVF